jgi:hypothetical protein
VLQAVQDWSGFILREVAMPTVKRGKFLKSNTLQGQENHYLSISQKKTWHGSETCLKVSSQFNDRKGVK